MSTTTIRIDDDLKVRVAAAAQRAGKTAHAFILDAISQTVEQVELDNAFNTWLTSVGPTFKPAAKQCRGMTQKPTSQPAPAVNPHENPPHANCPSDPAHDAYRAGP